MALPKRRQAERPVRTSVLGVPDPEGGQVEQADDRRQHPLARQAPPP
jgi:hypothetical protein